MNDYDYIDFEDRLKICHLCMKEIPKNYQYGYHDVVWKKYQFGDSRAIRNELGKIFENNSFRIRYFFHRRCKRMFLRFLKNGNKKEIKNEQTRISTKNI